MINNLRGYSEKDMLYAYIVIVSIILFVTISHLIDKHNVDKHKPPLTTFAKTSLFVLCFVATISGFSLITEEPVVTDEPGHLPYITQEIQTGFPEF